MSKIKSAKATPKQQTDANRPMKTKEKKYIWSRWMPWLGGILFCMLALYQLVGLNSEYLHAAQEHSLFLHGWDFFAATTDIPGGLVAWAGCYLTQFFYVPTLGASILILLWLAIYAILLRAFPIPKAWSPLALIPVFALLASVTGLGYWLYYIKMEGYWFASTVSILLVALGCWGYTSLPTPRTGKAMWLVKMGYIASWTIVGYPLLGWYALFGTLLMTISECTKHYIKEKKVSVISIFGAVALMGIVPLCWYYGFTRMRLADAWICGFPLFEHGDYTSWIMSLPFIIVAVGLCLLAVLSSLHTTSQSEEGKAHHLTFPHSSKSALFALAILMASAVLTWYSNFDDYNYHAELRMYDYAEKSDWKNVLKEVRDWQGTPTRQMVLMKNIALMNTGRLGTQMFRCDNGGKYPHRRDSLKVHLTQTVAPTIYYQYGKFNYATRWCIENGVECGFHAKDLKLLARCALLNGEYDAAEKYISQLKKTTFHCTDAEWLDSFRHNPALLDEEPSFRIPRELNKHMGNTLDTDNGFCEMYILHNFSKTMNVDSKLLQEVTLSYALVSKDISLFWPRFFQYATLHAGEEMPLHYQEAAYLYANLEKNVNISNMPFNKEKIVDKYAKFNQTVQGYIKRGLTTEQIGEIVKPTYGDTFWWFYFFCNNVESY